MNFRAEIARALAHAGNQDAHWWLRIVAERMDGGWREIFGYCDPTMAKFQNKLAVEALRELGWID